MIVCQAIPFGSTLSVDKLNILYYNYLIGSLCGCVIGAMIL